jgi:hypothetical protein
VSDTQGRTWVQRRSVRRIIANMSRTAGTSIGCPLTASDAVPRSAGIRMGCPLSVTPSDAVSLGYCKDRHAETHTAQILKLKVRAAGVWDLPSHSVWCDKASALLQIQPLWYRLSAHRPNFTAGICSSVAPFTLTNLAA